MAYLTSFKSSMPSQHWWPSKRKRRVGVSSFYWGATSRNTLSAGTFSPVWKELCVEKTLTKGIFKSSLFERLREAVNDAHFIVSGVNECEIERELQLYFTSPWGTARPIIWLNGRPFWSNGEGFTSFLSGWRRCKCRCAASDKLAN